MDVHGAFGDAPASRCSFMTPTTVVIAMGDFAAYLHPRPSAGKTRRRFLWVFQCSRSTARVAGGRRTIRSFAPLPRCTWMSIRSLSMPVHLQMQPLLEAHPAGVDGVRLWGVRTQEMLLL